MNCKRVKSAETTIFLDWLSFEIIEAVRNMTSFDFVFLKPSFVAISEIKVNFKAFVFLCLCLQSQTAKQSNDQSSIKETQRTRRR